MVYVLSMSNLIVLTRNTFLTLSSGEVPAQLTNRLSLPHSYGERRIPGNGILDCVIRWRETLSAMLTALHATKFESRKLEPAPEARQP